jgi:hypothetical protein
MTTASPQRTLWLVLGAIVAVLAILWTGFVMAGWTIGSVTKDEHHELPAGMTSLTIDASSADVTLVPSPSGVVVDSHAKGSLWLPKAKTTVDGSVVHVEGGCHVVVFGSCEARFTVGVPRGLPVTIDTGSGDVRASDVGGSLTVTARSGDVDIDGATGDDTVVTVTSGDIVARRVSGAADLRTTSGDIDAVDLDAGSVVAHATSGDVRVDDAIAPRSVKASATSGDVTVMVPDDGETYDASVDAASGDRHLGITSDPSSTRDLSAMATSGDAEIRYR